MILIKFGILLVSLSGIAAYENSILSTYSEWKNLDYQFPDATTRQTAITKGYWIAANQVLIDVDVWYGCDPAKVFVTIPRFQSGVPITLGTVSNTYSSNGPLIVPYPNYAWHSSNGNDCNGITSVFRIVIDKFNRLWVLDTGVVGTIQKCAPQILVFDLKTDTLIRRHRFPDNLYKPCVSLFVTPIVDVRDNTGTDTMVYIADTDGFGIIMYSYKDNISWRAQNKLMYSNPNYGTFNISNESFDLMDGVLGMSVSCAIGSQMAYYYSNRDLQLLATDRLLYFHSLSGGTENAVPLRYLDNKALWTNNFDSAPRAFFEIGSRGVQSAAEAIDRNGNLFFGLTSPNALACWDSKNSYSKPYINVVAQSDIKLQFASGVKIIPHPSGREELWTVSCRFQKIMTGSINYSEVNFRIQYAWVDNLLHGGTKCS